jgi:Ca2+/H+ antiporter, TMEM165/GDT1 family
MLSLLLTVFAAVFVAELIGDKTLYTVGALTARHRTVPVFVGSALAASAKMFVAVMAGRLVASLPPLILSIISAVTFLGMAIAIWFKKPEDESKEPVPGQRFWKTAALAFAAIFFTEWADVGQITVAVLAAQRGAPFIVWLGASLAMLTKIVLSATVGLGLRRWVPVRALRVASAAACLVMAVATVIPE